MAGMRDPLTEAPPPSRFDPEELNIFGVDASPEVLLPPSIVWSPWTRAHLQSGKLHTQLLIVGLSKVSVQLVHHLSNKVVAGSVLLPGSSMAKNAIEPSPQDRTCFIYVCNSDLSIVLASVQYDVSSDRASLWTKSLFQAIQPERVVVLEQVPIQHFRGRLPVDEPSLFFLKSVEQKLEDVTLKEVTHYYPPGSLVDGLAAALLTHCQLRSLKGQVILTWPADDVALVHMLVVALTALLDKTPQGSMVNFLEAGKAYLARRKSVFSDLYI